MKDSLGYYMDTIRSHQENFPVHVYQIASAMGIEICHSETLPDNVSGFIKRHDTHTGTYEIHVNGSHSKSRQRFTIAHELAHFILHKDKIGDCITDDALYRSSLSSRIEVEANELAMNILMPWHLLEPRLKENHVSVNSLARDFDVSTSAMSVRLGIPYEYMNIHTL
jgi:Zn-dependent peptidase ImmA (M78 family)